jgi:hypothetical protein
LYKNYLNFFRNETFIVKFVSSERTFYSWVFGVGSTEEMKKFGFRVKFFGSMESASYEGPVISIDKPTRDVINEKAGLVMSNEFVRRIWNGKTIAYEVQVFEKK